MNTNNGLEYDQLTGLYNRWHCRMALQQILDEGGNRVFGVIDLDGFSQINEQYGSPMGDKLLQAIAQTLREAYQGAILGRISGDEFCFILPRTEYSRYNMSMMTREVFIKLHEINVEGIDGHRLSFSIGSSFIDVNLHSNPDAVYREATELRLEAKKHEGNFLCSRYGYIPDVEGAFMILRDDRTLYNNINNRLFSIHDQNDWINFIHEGATIKGSMYKRNQSHLDDILNYYSKGDLPEFDYELLFQLIVNYVSSLDAFMYEMLIDNILLPYYEKCDITDIKIKSRLGHLYLLMADGLLSVVRMGDKTQSPRIREYLTKCMNVTRGLPHNRIEFEPYFYALCESLGHFECFEQQYEDGLDNRLYEELRELMLGSDPFVIPNQEVYKYFESVVNNARFYPIYRTCFLLLKGQQLSEKEKEEITHRITYVKGHLVNGVFDMAGNNPEYINLATYLQGIILNDLDADQILDRIVLGLNNVKDLEYGTLSESNLIIVAYLFLGASQALISSNREFNKKRQIALSGLRLLINILRKRESLATDPQILFLTQVLIRTMISTPLLTPMDKFYYLERALASISLDTYSHSKAVAAYAKVILTHIIDHKPILLVGNDRPYNSLEEVKANRDNLLRFMEYACMLHDVGKMNLSPISNNAFRRLTEQEFSLIRRHPKAGIEILRYEPSFKPFFPFVYTHHRWWNGEYGYPTIEKTEEKSRLQYLVYVLSFCDSLEAATSRIGRNYRTAKTFLQIFDEFYVEAGSRYSSDVLQSIIQSPQIYATIRQMVDYNWEHIYQSIFHEIVSDNDFSQAPGLEDVLPDPYQHSPEIKKPQVDLLKRTKITVPKWMLEMDKETLLLHSLSMMERDCMSVKNTDIIIFFYNVELDRIGIISPQRGGQVQHTFGNNFSEHRLDTILSEDSYNKAIHLMYRIINENDYPKQGQVKLENNDKSRCMLVSYTSVIDSNGMVRSIVGQMEDINTNRQRLLQTINLQNKYIDIYDNLINKYSTVVYTDVDLEHFEILKSFDLVQQQANRFTTTKELIEFTREKLVDPEYHDGFRKFCDKDTILERFKYLPKVTFEYHSKVSGWLYAHIIPGKYDRKGKLTHLLFLTENIELEHKQRDLLSQAASLDALTGLYNRLKGEELISQCILNGGSQIFAIMDCDHFKRINDQLSHLVGDKVLRELSHSLKQSFADGTIMRLGGDEFVIYYHGDKANHIINTFNGIQKLFQHFKDKVSTIHLPELENIAPTMSCGVVYTDGSVSDLDFEELYKFADEALRESKQFRNGTVTISEIRYRRYYR